MASTRRLAAILAVDVTGYSRLMGTDEEGTHERLQAHFRQFVDPKIEEHRGHIVKNITRPVRVYTLRRQAVADLPASSVPPATSISQRALAPRLSIVVLPFA